MLAEVTDGFEFLSNKLHSILWKMHTGGHHYAELSRFENFFSRVLLAADQPAHPQIASQPSVCCMAGPPKFQPAVVAC